MIITGGIDLSTGAVVALASIVSAKLMRDWLPGHAASGALPTGVAVAAVGLTVLMGAFIGVYHATLINFLRLPPFIATLASLAGLRSLAAILSENRPISIPFASYRILGKDPYVTVPIFAVLGPPHEHHDGLDGPRPPPLCPRRQ